MRPRVGIDTTSLLARPLDQRSVMYPGGSSSLSLTGELWSCFHVITYFDVIRTHETALRGHKAYHVETIPIRVRMRMMRGRSRLLVACNNHATKCALFRDTIYYASILPHHIQEQCLCILTRESIDPQADRQRFLPKIFEIESLIADLLPSLDLLRLCLRLCFVSGNMSTFGTFGGSLCVPIWCEIVLSSHRTC